MNLNRLHLAILPATHIIFGWAVALLLVSLTTALWAEQRVTFIVTSDSHYDAFENEDRNERNRITIDQMNQIATVAWPDELGGELIGEPRGVLLLGDVIDDGDRMVEGKNQSEQQNHRFLADFGFDGTDGRLKYAVLEGWGNHDGPPLGRERYGFSFQKQLKQRNTERMRRGMIDHLSDNGLHYSWDWGGVHFVQLNLFPADKPHPEVRYSPQYHDPQNALAFLQVDLADHLQTPNQPVVVAHHYDLQGTDWWHDQQRKAYFDVIRPYNIAGVFHGHTGTGIYRWKPEEDERDALHVINTGQTENGFFVVQITADRIRLGYRAKMNVQVTRQPDGKERRDWDGTWGWRFLHDHELEKSAFTCAQSTVERTIIMMKPRASCYPAMLLCLLIAPRLTVAESPTKLPRDYNIAPVLFSSVYVDDSFWTPRLETSRKVTIPYAFQQCEETDRISNFEKAAGLKEGKHEGASFVHVSLDAIKDQNLPADSADSSNLQLDFWPHLGTTEWVQFEWDTPQKLSRVKVYWFDDTGRGACHLPASWRILYRRSNGQFTAVENRGSYGVEKDKFNQVEFDPVTTTAIKLEIKLQEEWSAGIQEVVIE